MNTRLLITCIFLFFASISIAQNDTLPPPDFTIKGVAIGISAPEMIESMMLTMPGVGSNAKALLNEQSIKSYLMPPRKAEQPNAFNSYLLATCMEFYTNFERNYKVNLSPDFVALSLSKEGNLELKNALRFLVTDGTVSADIMPYDSPNIPRSVYATDKYKIINYLQIIRDTHRERQKVFEVQKALMRGNPVVVEMKVPEGFDQVKDTKFWTSLGNPGEKLLPFVVVGYNLDLEAFELLGAWGREWGNNGYLWVDFDDFGEMAQNGFVMVPR